MPVAATEEEETEMSTIHQTARFETLDQETIDRGMMQGRKLRSQAFVAALKAMFSRNTDERTRQDGRHIPDCAATA